MGNLWTIWMKHNAAKEHEKGTLLASADAFSVYSRLRHNCHMLLSIAFRVCLFFWIPVFQALWISIAQL